MHGYSDTVTDSICTYGSGGVNSLFGTSTSLFILGTIMFGLVLFALGSILIMYMASRSTRPQTQAIPEEPSNYEAMEILKNATQLVKSVLKNLEVKEMIYGNHIILLRKRVCHITCSTFLVASSLFLCFNYDKEVLHDWRKDTCSRR